MKPNHIIVNLFFWIGVLAPIFVVSYGFVQVQIFGDYLYWGADPGKHLVHILGQWSVGFLLFVLSIPLIKQYTGYNLVRYKRRVGLSVFLYGLLHLFAYLILMLGWDFSVLAEDIEKRPYILVGALALLCLLPMSITSTKGWQKRLRKNWKKLHLLIYPALFLVIIHLWWQVKAGALLAFSITAIAILIIGLKLFKNAIAHRKASSNL